MNHWDRIEAFTEVVRLGTFSSAARHLNVSASHISRLVVKLEQQLGTQLLYRTTRKIRLTDAGRLYYEHCRHLFEGFREAEAAINDLQSSPRGVLKITAGYTFGERYIVPLLNDFMQQHPQLEVRLHLTNRRVDLIEEGYDLAIRIGPMEDSSLIARRLWTREELVVASPAYLAQYGEPANLQDLVRHQCLIGSRDRWLFSDQGMRREVRVQGRLHANSGMALLDAALKGLGLVQLPAYYIGEYLETGALVPVLEPYAFRDSAIWVVYPQHRHLSSKVRMFIDFLVEEIERNHGL
ncbi:MAG: LysR family transcriptional regulator [Nitrincola lacisaponensis]|uniref:Transcriptional regulator, LysR family, in formaldehyde detoxification operon n=1 Tax=Nitrincola lacisaponensis TaxID=267850 RepID=A0A063Y960_9GAMM|nr:LysR family transcriptional regulator [Nitrincola lacisaponensis]KDE41271.1 Transcriptional regulator, LysR family, in formaldehyde detoxification operon [Nitrincola lacisaponensis]